jgi:hypothetical protein
MEYVVNQHSKYDFYNEFKRWSNLHGFPIVSDLVLPENVFVCYNKNDTPLYCIWFYRTDSRLAWVAFPMSNKDIPYNKREKALEFLMNYVSEYAKKENFVSLITTSNTIEVISVLEKCNYKEADLNINQYIKTL